MAVDYLVRLSRAESYPWYYDPPTGATSTGNKTSSYVTFRDRKLGYNSPGFPNSLQTNPYFRSVYRASGSPWSYFGIYTNGATAGGTEPIGVMCGTNELWPTDYTSERLALEDIIKAKLQSKIGDLSVNLAQAYAERRQVSNLVASTAHRLAQSMFALRRGNVPEAVRHLTGSRGRPGLKRSVGGIPEQWLALQYGWKPLIQDVHGACEAIARSHSDRIPVQIYDAAASQPLPAYNQVFSSVGYTPSVRKVRSNGTVRGRGRIALRVSSAFAADMANTGITNPALLAWELLPYSFVVDWFYPVGSYLERLDYTRGLEYVSGWVVTFVQDTMTVSTVNPTVTYMGATLTYSGGRFTSQCSTTGRSLMNSFPPVKPPRLKDPFSTTHVANALSLLATAFGSKKALR